METEEESTKRTEEASSSGFINPQLPFDLADQAQVLKGDAIGNTLYSERFVLKTLIKLSQIKLESWTEDFENELCFLWDMTTEKDVVLVLKKHDFLQLAVSLLGGPLQEPRFIEIIVGILRNMCCVEEVRQVISERSDINQLLLRLLTIDDTLTLIQLGRLLHTIAWDLVKQEDQRNSSNQKHWLEVEMDSDALSKKFSFLLKSSTNVDLLICILDLLHTFCASAPALSDKDFSHYFATADMVNSLLECWHQLLTVFTSLPMDEDVPFQTEPMGSELFINKQIYKAATKWMAIIASFTGHEKGREALVQNGNNVKSVMYRILSLPYEEESDNMLIDVMTALESLIATHFDGAILKLLLTMLNKVMLKYAADNRHMQVAVMEAFEDYFESAVRYGSKDKLTEALESCDDDLVVLFWNIIRKRDQDLVDRWESIESDETPFGERSI